MPDEPELEVPDGAAVFPLIPEELHVHPLLLAVLHAVVFLDGSSDDVVHPAAASEALEYLATYLQRLRGPERRRVQEDMDCLVAYARQERWPKSAVRFLQTFLADFGVPGDDQA
ncbi:MAG: hypothetical protein NZ700_04860 [Gemmataceae bacterium]|nr:hypothetical protein [Gemmataceae bacterium]MDW8266595.1 hypothetical protein [Gemmataceae bacterium]